MSKEVKELQLREPGTKEFNEWTLKRLLYRFLPVLDPGEQDDEPDVEGDQVEVELGQVEVVGEVEGDEAGVHRRQELVDVVAEVEQVDEGVVVEAEALADLVPQGLEVAQGLEN